MRKRTAKRSEWWLLACAALVATAACADGERRGWCRFCSEAEWVEALINVADIPDSLRPGWFDDCLDLHGPTGRVFQRADDVRDEARRLLDAGQVEAARREAVEAVRLAGEYAARTACGR